MTDKPPSFFSTSSPSKLLSLRLRTSFPAGIRFSPSFPIFQTPHKLNTSWFVKVKEFALQMQNQIKTLALYLFPGRKVRNTFDRRIASRRCGSLPYALKCLSLKLRFSIILDCAAFMDGLFWIYHPEILSVSCTYHVEGRDGCLLEFLRKTFESREDDDGTSKCWWQWSNFKAKDIIVKYTKGNKKKYRGSNLQIRIKKRPVKKRKLSKLHQTASNYREENLEVES